MHSYMEWLGLVRAGNSNVAASDDPRTCGGLCCHTETPARQTEFKILAMFTTCCVLKFSRHKIQMKDLSATAFPSGLLPIPMKGLCTITFWKETRALYCKVWILITRFTRTLRALLTICETELRFFSKRGVGCALFGVAIEKLK